MRPTRTVYSLLFAASIIFAAPVEGTSNRTVPSRAPSASSPLLNVISPADFGARCDGVTDDSRALQAAFNAAGNGSTVYIPGKCVSRAALTLSTAIHLKGGGCSFLGNIGFNTVPFRWAAASGSVIWFTNPASEGIVYHNAADGFQAPELTDLCLIGPGHGSSAGLSLGKPGDCGVSGIDQAYMANVFIGNFPTGMSWYSVEQGTFVGVRLRGNEYGLVVGDTCSNANVLLGGDIIANAAYGLFDHSGGTGNVFVGTEFGTNANASASLEKSVYYSFLGNYWEDDSGQGFDIALTNTIGVRIANATALKRGIAINTGTSGTSIDNSHFAGARIVVSPTASSGNYLGIHSGTLAVSDPLSKLAQPFAVPTTVVAYFSRAVTPTGDGSAYTLTPDTIVQDSNSELSVRTGVLAAKSRENICASGFLLLRGIDRRNTTYALDAVTTSLVYHIAEGNLFELSSNGIARLNFSSPAMLLGANDTLTLRLTLSGAPTKNVTIEGGRGNSIVSLVKCGAIPP